MDITNPIRKNPTRVEWGLVLSLVLQTTALIWGAAKLSASVENLNRNMENMSDYAVLRYRVEQNEHSVIRLNTQVDQLQRKK